MVQLGVISVPILLLRIVTITRLNKISWIIYTQMSCTYNLLSFVLTVINDTILTNVSFRTFLLNFWNSDIISSSRFKGE